MRKKSERVIKICKVCQKEYEVIKKRENTSHFCSNDCKFFYSKSPEGRKIKSMSVKLQWDKDFERKKILSNKMTERMSLESSKNISRENLKKHNDLHRGKGNGIKHTETHKNYMKELMTNRCFSQETIEKMKEGHWSKKEDRENIIERCRTTKNIRIANGEITFNNLGVSGEYRSLKTSLKEKYDSLTELHRMIQLDNDKDIIYWTKKHQMRIPYFINGRNRDYIPDFLIITNTKKIIEEIKSSWSQKLHGELNSHKNAAAEKYAIENGYEFIWKIIDLDNSQVKEIRNIHNSITI